jgi:hypothetical protein
MVQILSIFKLFWLGLEMSMIFGTLPRKIKFFFNKKIVKKRRNILKHIIFDA